MNKKGIYIPPLAYAIIIIFIIILVAAFVPAVKQTIIDIVGAATAHK